MKTSLPHSMRLCAFALAAVGLTQATATAQFDCQVGFIEVSQAMPNTSLTAGRSTYVRVEALLTNPPSDPVDLDGVMRVYVNGVETPDSPVYSRNGPFEAKTNPNFNVKKSTLNFAYLPPTSNNVVFTVELNAAGPNFVAESNTANNFGSTPVMNFQVRAVPDFAYAPIDYQGPTGGCCATGLPDEALIEPGVGDNFIQGIYPAKDIYYHRIDQPSKLWTQNLANTGSSLLNSLQQNWFQMSPRPDFLYGWVPGSLPGYNGQAQLNSAISMGNTQAIRHQRTYAHEVGHNTGLSHTSWNIIDRGFDTEHHLNITEGLSSMKQSSLRNIMDAGLLTQDAWVRDTHYESFFNDPKFANPAPAAPTAPALAITGLWTVADKTLAIDGLFEVDPVAPTVSVDSAGADFEISAYRGSDLAQRLYIVSSTVTDSCAAEDLEDEGEETSSTDSVGGVPVMNFNAVLPHGGQAFDQLVIIPMGRVEAEPIVLDRSPNAPEIQFVTPGPGGQLDSARFQLAWSSYDADGDDLTYYVRYSRDGVAFTPLAAGITETTLDVDLTQLPGLVNGVGFFEVQAVDGLNATVLRSDSLVVPGSISALLVNDPWVHISTPDDGKKFERGASVFLHAQGWDIEDRGLEGGEMVWTSDLDGVIGTGRLLTVTALTVGTHVLTVTGTDSDGRTAADTTMITINDRGLPGESFSTTFYCTPGTSASGCQSNLSVVGTPSATAPTGFTVTASTIEGVKDGLFFFGTSGQQSNSWGSGTSFQCVVPPTIRTGTISGGGTLGACDGSASRDMNAAWTAIPAKNPGAGAVVQLQYWYRDPQNTSNQTTSLSDAVEFQVEP